jgi:riboflavin kinase
VEIEGFRREDRTFGPVKCFPAIIGNAVKGAVLLAGRSHYDSSVIEIVAPVNMRKSLKLKDGHKVKVEVFALP